MGVVSNADNNNKPYILDTQSKAQKAAENRPDLIRCCTNGKDYTIKPNPVFLSLNADRFVGRQGGNRAPKHFYSANVCITTTEGGQYKKPQRSNGLVSVDPEFYGEAFVESSKPDPNGRGIKITTSEGKTEVYDLIGTIPVDKLSQTLGAIEPKTQQAEKETPKVEEKSVGAEGKETQVTENQDNSDNYIDPASGQSVGEALCKAQPSKPK